MNDSKRPGIAIGPFKVIEQAPGEIALERHSGSDGALCLREMVAEVIYPSLVVDPSVGGDNILERRAVFGDVERASGA